jgi:ubiquinone/menaquinone biosynthesis C-methylase UbiE
MSTVLYTDLSIYYDLMCADIDYQGQSDFVRRLHQIFGQGKNYIDLACGTGPHIRHFIDYGYQCHGVDINQAMLDIAQKRCPEATFELGNMSEFVVTESVDLISCFLYSLHYCQDIKMLQSCIKCVYQALNAGGMFCFNAVDKNTIDNSKFEQHVAQFDNSEFRFTSAWHYSGEGNQQSLNLNIEKSSNKQLQKWHDQHSMVAVSFEQLQQLLRPYFDVTLFEHDYSKLIEWDNKSGNAIFCCIKK